MWASATHAGRRTVRHAPCDARLTRMLGGRCEQALNPKRGTCQACLPCPERPGLPPSRPPPPTASGLTSPHQARPARSTATRTCRARTASLWWSTMASLPTTLCSSPSWWVCHAQGSFGSHGTCRWPGPGQHLPPTAAAGPPAVWATWYAPAPLPAPPRRVAAGEERRGVRQRHRHRSGAAPVRVSVAQEGRQGLAPPAGASLLLHAGRC